MAQALNHLWSRFPHPRPSTTVVFFSRTLNPCLSRQTPPIQPHTSPISKPLYFSISSPGSPSFCSVTSLISQSLTFLASYSCSHSFALPSSSIGLPRPSGQCRFLSASFSDKNKNKEFGEVAVVGSDESQFQLNTVGQFGSNVSLMNISEIIEVIRSDEDDLEFKLNEICLNLSVEFLSGIFRVLNCEKLSALRFFIWAQDKNPSSHGNPHICSLIIDNCGRLDDYDTMLSLLKDFRKKGICLNEKAFGFLPVLGSNRASIMDSIRRVVELLNEVGGSCRGSGICVLVKMLCKVDLYEMAKFVIEITDRRASYYNIIILERCRKCCFGEARDMLEEMRQASCNPDAKTYNYLLSALCKHDRAAEACSLLEEMKEKGCPPNSLTFEIFIYYSCRLGKLDSAVKFFDHMVSLGLEPRLTTHAVFIKSFFHSRQYEEAYNYVVNSGDKYKPSGNMIYSLLASLHQRNGDLITAGDILINMMDKGLIPSFPVYMRILKRLHKSGRGQLASYVKNRFSILRSGSSNVT